MYQKYAYELSKPLVKRKLESKVSKIRYTSYLEQLICSFVLYVIGSY